MQPVGDLVHLGDLGAEEEDRAALGGERAQDLVDLGLAGDVDAAGRLLEREHARLAITAAAIATFCWLPPLSERIAVSMLAP